MASNGRRNARGCSLLHICSLISRLTIQRCFQIKVNVPLQVTVNILLPNLPRKSLFSCEFIVLEFKISERDKTFNAYHY